MAFLTAALMIFPLAGCKINNIANNTSEFASDYNVSAVANEKTNSELEAKNGSQSTSENKDKPSGNATAVESNYTIKNGSTPMENGLNFGGKKFTLAVFIDTNYNKESLDQKASEFGQKYNCTIEITPISFAGYNKTVAAKMSSGAPFDIITMHGSFFPDNVIANLCQPLENSFTSADLCDNSNPGNGGIDMNKAKNFNWNNHLYGVAGYNSVFPYVMFYNKKMFKEAGITDPMALYNAGRWNWDAIKQIGARVTDQSKGVYFGSSEFTYRVFPLANGGHYVNFGSSSVTENLTDGKIYNALTFLQDICSGQNKIINTKNIDAWNPSDFYNGNTYAHIQESDYYMTFAAEIPKMAAFDKNLDNLGIVPIPLGNDNTDKEYPTGWVTAFGSGKGSDPRVTIAWAKYNIEYDRQNSKMRAEDQTLIDSLISGNINYPNYGFSDSSDSVYDIIAHFEADAATGSNISKLLNDNRQKIQNCIDVAIKKQ